MESTRRRFVGTIAWSLADLATMYFVWRSIGQQQAYAGNPQHVTGKPFTLGREELLDIIVDAALSSGTTLYERKFDLSDTDAAKTGEECGFGIEVTLDQRLPQSITLSANYFDIEIPMYELSRVRRYQQRYDPVSGRINQQFLGEVPIQANQNLVDGYLMAVLQIMAEKIKYSNIYVNSFLKYKEAEAGLMEVKPVILTT